MDSLRCLRPFSALHDFMASEFLKQNRLVIVYPSIALGVFCAGGDAGFDCSEKLFQNVRKMQRETGSEDGWMVRGWGGC